MTTLQRLQMCALALPFKGIKNVVRLIGDLQVLERLGTICPEAAEALDLSNDCPELEELVLSNLVDETYKFLNCFVSNFQRKKRTKLRRLAVHITCADGLASVPENVEKALVSAFCQIVHNLMAVGGWISLSVDTAGMKETALYAFNFNYFECKII